MKDTNRFRTYLIQTIGIGISLVFMFLAFERANEVRDINHKYRDILDSYRLCTEDSSRCDANSNIEIYSKKSHHELDTNINLIFIYLLFSFLILGALEKMRKRKSNHTLKNLAKDNES